MSEKDVARQIDDMLKINGAFVWPIKEPFCPHCRRYTGHKDQAGVPDRFVVIGFLGFFLELKRPGNKPAKDQHAFLVHCRDGGIPALWADRWETVRDFLVAYNVKLKVKE